MKRSLPSSSHHRRTLAACLAGALGVTGTVALLVAAAGDLDPTFDGDGKVLTDFAARQDGILALAIQPDGKIVAAGYSSAPAGSDFALVRYDVDGSLDGTFGFLGKVVSDFGGHERAEGVVVQADGKIIVAGTIGFTDFLLVRYTADGLIDSTFGAAGKVTTDFGGLEQLAAIATNPADGKIIAVGSRDSAWVLARYNPTDGSLDMTFDADGKVVTPWVGQTQARHVAAHSDGRIVVAGFNDATGFDVNAVLVGYTSTGQLDATFGGGRVFPDFGGDGVTTVVAIQEDGKVVTAGEMPGSNGADFVLARYATDGVLDLTFNGVGYVLTDFGGSEKVTAITLQPDGKIVAAGRTSPGFRERFAVARYNVDGSLDTTFGAGGTVLADFHVEGANDWIAIPNDVVIQDGHIVAAGTAWSGLTGDTDFGLMRFLGAGNTPAGNNVAVQVDDVGLTFASVTQAGDTVVAKSATGPTPPAGFSLGNPPTYFDMTTTALFSGPIEICISYAGIAYDDETALALMHYEGASWVNVTTTLDTVNDIICGNVTSLSPFIVVAPSFIPAAVIVSPGTINKKAKGAYVTVYIEFAEGRANPADIDVHTITLSALGATASIPEGSPTTVGDTNGNGVVDLAVKFDRATIQGWFSAPGEATVLVRGRFTAGGAFQGEATIRMIDEGSEHVNESDPASIRR